MSVELQSVARHQPPMLWDTLEQLPVASANPLTFYGHKSSNAISGANPAVFVKN